ncbi:metallophosphoesterase [Leptolyngbya ohadii]|uniref:metallophosphoesterase n=1 Tax=Leptolyngbya ohadii TaxID=1962290 RepID=UPI001CED4118|nr:metallophosphoesterase [Leptolyngbya ohadii]
MAVVRVRQHVNPLSDKYQQPASAPVWEKVYAELKQPLHLDIGCARGQFVLEMAQQLPLWNFLGLEIREPLVIQANKLREEAGLTNLHYVFCNANNSVRSLLASLPAGVLQRVSIPAIEQALDHLTQLDLDFLLLPGDLTQHGEPENHAWLADRLSCLPFPAYVIPGNPHTPPPLKKLYSHQAFNISALVSCLSVSASALSATLTSPFRIPSGILPTAFTWSKSAFRRSSKP